MLESIHIRNFRGIGEGSLEGFARINLLIGPNNSGKSTLLEALYLLGTVGKDEGSLFGLQISKTPPQQVNLGIRADCYGKVSIARIRDRHNLRETSAGSIDLSFKLDNDHRFAFDKTFFALRAKSSKGISGSYALAETGEELGFGGHLNLFLKDKSLTHFKAELGSLHASGTIPNSETTFFHDADIALSNIPMSFARQLMSEMRGGPQRLSQSCSRLLECEDAPISVSFLPKELEPEVAQMLLSPPDQFPLTVDEYGDGTRSALKLLAPLLLVANKATPENPGLLLWEEPEVFQNPRLLKKLMEELAIQIKDRPVQVFIATHSLEVIGNLLKLTSDDKLAPSDLKAFRLDLDEGKLKSSWFDRDNLVGWLEAGLDPRIWGEFSSPIKFYLDNPRASRDAEGEE